MLEAASNLAPQELLRKPAIIESGTTALSDDRKLNPGTNLVKRR